MPRTVPVSVQEVPYFSRPPHCGTPRSKPSTTSSLTAPPAFWGYATSTQSIVNANTMTALNLDTEVLDPDGGHSTVTNTSRYTATVPGTYLVFGSVGWSNNNNGDRRIQISLNGAGVIGSGVSINCRRPSSTDWSPARDHDHERDDRLRRSHGRTLQHYYAPGDQRQRHLLALHARPVDQPLTSPRPCSPLGRRPWGFRMPTSWSPR